ncbi:MAG: hypothetical protein KKF41_00350 [Actinobacteria bacterium]|nr:hypothetical protein [Actinomycetota bacterium]MBU1942696.1 hypothetical protein [Actinomycetota bacterium]MBU2686018.1 hypothetical protein [Actinomycetota bacterium]
MANKRIELEQYKYYIDLLVEDPARKKARRGVATLLIAAMVMSLAFFVLGFLSNDTAGSLTDIMQKPPAKAPAGDTQVPQQQLPEGIPQIPQQQLPEGIPPIPQQQLPEGIPPIPSETEQPQVPVSPSPGSRLPATDAIAMPFDAPDGALLARAQAAPGQETTPTVDIPAVDESAPDSTAPGSSAPTSSAPKKTGPGTTTRGAASLSKLATSAGGRGFEIYLLAVFFVLMIALYVALRRVRLEAKAK